MPHRKIDITQPDLPPLDEFMPYLEEIWRSKALTNAGPFHNQLENALRDYLGIEHISLVSSGTSALLIALEATDITGDVITTPFTFAATTHVLRWKGITPIFADIDPDTLNLDPAKVEAAITPRTTAILAVHIYGQPSDVVALQRIAEAHHLKLIYDAAHSFGVEDQGGSILRHGDLSALSFHATKVFTTIEGGAIVSHDGEMKQRIDRLRNFGLGPDDTVPDTGINGKLNEIQAAFGLMQLGHVKSSIAKRREIDNLYRRNLADIEGISMISPLPGTTQNYSYFPILVRAEYRETRDALYARLQARQIFARRYFYPLISNIPTYNNLPSATKNNLVAANICAEQILCLPISANMDVESANRVVDALRN